jgi:glycosyltransferase involved in cell wall biosynthesis
VYIGNASRAKGVEEVYRALKDSPYTLFMTGHTRDTAIPVPCFNLERRDYLCMLKASSVVLTMSVMLEGWNRVAHEAMLCGTPVVGSGSGGMRELLVSGGQAIYPGGPGLAEVTAAVINRRAELGPRGYEYVRHLDLPYFTRAWVQLAEDLLGVNPGRSPEA